MNEPKPEDVMKALACCRDNGEEDTCEYCKECPSDHSILVTDEGGCMYDMYTAAIECIREQSAEIERLKAHNKELDNLCNLMHQKLDEGYAEFANEERAEAITEFAERLKSEVNGGQFASYKGLEIRNVIDQIEKEMKESSDGSDGVH